MKDPIFIANKLSELVKYLAQEHKLSPQQIRKLTQQDVVRFYSKHENISASK